MGPLRLVAPYKCSPRLDHPARLPYTSAMITIPKIVLIILLIFGVWYAMRWLNRGSSIVARRRQQPPPGPSPRPQPAIEDLVACRACGAYVATGAPNCGKTGCPQPRWPA